MPEQSTTIYISVYGIIGFAFIFYNILIIARFWEKNNICNGKVLEIMDNILFSGLIKVRKDGYRYPTRSIKGVACNEKITDFLYDNCGVWASEYREYDIENYGKHFHCFNIFSLISFVVIWSASVLFLLITPVQKES